MWDQLIEGPVNCGRSVDLSTIIFDHLMRIVSTWNKSCFGHRQTPPIQNYLPQAQHPLAWSTLPVMKAPINNSLQRPYYTICSKISFKLENIWLSQCFQAIPYFTWPRHQVVCDCGDVKCKSVNVSLSSWHIVNPNNVVFLWARFNFAMKSNQMEKNYYMDKTLYENESSIIIQMYSNDTLQKYAFLQDWIHCTVSDAFLASFTAS